MHMQVLNVTSSRGMPRENSIAGMAFTADGTALLVASETGLNRWSVSTGTRRTFADASIL